MSLQALALGQSRGDRRLFEGIDFSLQPGEALWVQGANGSGKTSLLRVLCGLALPLSGEVRWRGRPLRQAREAFHAELAWCGHGHGLKDDLSALENLAGAAAIAGRPCNRGQALAALASLDLAASAALPARALSQGQRKRVVLARLFLADPPALWVLDEPFSALDAGSVARLQGRLDTHLAQGGLVVFTTHQPLSLRPQARLHTLELSGNDTASWHLH
jgi:heme exporter protein A